MFKLIRRPFRPLYRSAMIAFAWSNRRDIVRWASFAKRAASPASRPTLDDLKVEARVRASISVDPVLRNDRALRDLRVRDGVVTLQTPAGWNNRALAVSRLEQIGGVESVHTATDLATVDSTQPVSAAAYLSTARAAS